MLIRFVVKRASICHSSSEHVCKLAGKISRETVSKFNTFFWGIIPQSLIDEPSENMVHKMEKELGLTGKRIVLSARGLGEIYRPKQVAEIIRGNANNLDNRKIVFVILRVNASDNDVSNFKKMMQDFEDSYIFVNRMLSEEELAYLYHKSLAHISIPSSDSLGGGVVEPAMCGSYPILSDLPGNRWFIDNYFGKVIIKSEDVNFNLLFNSDLQDPNLSGIDKVRIDMCSTTVKEELISMYERACR